MNSVIVPVVSYPRTGSTYLMSILGGVLGVQNLLEVFHPDPDAFELTLMEKITDTYGSFEKFSNAKEQDPVSVLSALRIDGSSVQVFKIFPYHLEEKALRGVLTESTVCIFMLRNPLDAWVSRQIAIDLGTYWLADTSDRYVAFDSADFSLFVLDSLNHIIDARRLADALGLPQLWLNYEELISAIDASAYVWDRLGPALNFNNATPVDGWTPGVWRQDGRGGIDRLTNGPDCIRWLLMNGLEALGESIPLPSEMNELEALSLRVQLALQSI